MVLTALIITLALYACTYITGIVSSNLATVRPGMPAGIHYAATTFFLLSVVMTIVLAVTILHSFGIEVNPKPIGL